MTWLDEELLGRTRKTSALTAGIGMFLLGVLLVSLLAVVVQGLLPQYNDVPGLATLMVIGFAPFLIWFIIGGVRGFR